MEVIWFSTPEGGVTKSQQDQDLVDFVFEWEGVVHYESTPPGQTINKEYYLRVLPWLVDTI